MPSGTIVGANTYCWYVYGPGNSNNWPLPTNPPPPVGATGGGGGSGGSGNPGGTGPVATVLPPGSQGTVRTEESCSAPISVIRQAARDGAIAALGREPVSGDEIRVFSDAQDSYGRSRVFVVSGTQFVTGEGSCGGTNSGGGGGGYIP